MATASTDHSYSTLGDSRQIHMGLMRLYFKGLHSLDNDVDGLDMPNTRPDSMFSLEKQQVPVIIHGKQSTDITLSEMQSAEMDSAKHSSASFPTWDTLDTEELYTMELKAYTTVGETIKAIKITVLNVTSVIFKCRKCNLPLEKQLSYASFDSSPRHICRPNSHGRPPLRSHSRVSKNEQAKCSIQERGSSGNNVSNIPSLETHPGESVVLPISSRPEQGLKPSQSRCASNMDDTNNDVVICNLNDQRGNEGLFEQAMLTENLIASADSEVDDPHAKQKKKGEPKQSFKCSLCDKVYKHNASLKLHMRVHTGERPYKCECCGKAFQKSSILYGHMKIHGGEKKYLCHICGFKFLRKSDQTAHIRAHTDSFNIRCKVCGRGFKSNVHLGIHMRKHTGEEPFLCTVCGRGFKYQYGFENHMRQHEFARNPLLCPECKVEFADLDELRLHTCSAGKKLLCIVCGRSFPYTSALKGHMITHTRPKSSACLFCEELFSNDLELQMHLDENIVACVTCNTKIKDARACMLKKLPGNVSSAKMFKCLSCHGNEIQQVSMETQTEYDSP